jgi:hypothetical protein
MDIPTVLLIFFILLVPATVILVPRYMRSRERQRILDTVMQAAEKGISLPENVIQSLIRAAAGASLPIPSDPARDMRRGVFLVAIGLAFMAIGLAVLANIFPHRGRAGWVFRCGGRRDTALYRDGLRHRRPPGRASTEERHRVVAAFPDAQLVPEPHLGAGRRACGACRRREP